MNRRISPTAVGLASAGLVLLAAPGGAHAGAVCRTVGLAGASGSLRATGTFFFTTGGRSTWQGTVCLP